MRRNTDARGAAGRLASPAGVKRAGFVMNIGGLCHRNAVTVGRFDELIKAAQLMRERHIGYLVVVDETDGKKRPVGVLTDRDIVITVVARETDPRTLRAGDIMTQQPVTVSEADPVEKALREMRRVGVRRLPVITPQGELAGIVSLDDVLDFLAGELQNVAASIRNERLIEGTLRP
ncbi:MAG TPA: CBS domain-containing protein [Steroidobacteraceae bacterium]|nr:CBS domain-containing protein [Steroidobacteraceae bacterium]